MFSGAHGRQATRADRGDTPRPALFDAIGAFLADQRLSPEPANYTLAWQVLTQPDGALAREVRALTDGGVRLNRADLERLGGAASSGPNEAREAFDEAVAAAHRQVGGFADLVRSVHDDTRGFGRDLAASAAAFDRADADEAARLTEAMIARVTDAEARLAAATGEADRLRTALDEARGDARRDVLTELPNRRAFEEAIGALPPGTPTLLAICDVDHFKAVNDRFGHAVGDRVLRAIGQTLEAACQPHLVARLGGEEFVVVLTDVDRSTACTVLEEARAAVAAKRFRLRETDAPIGTITLSVGLAPFVGGAALSPSLAAADAALYAAKGAGRDRLEIAPEIGG